MRRLENAAYGLMFIVAIAVCCFLPVTRAQKTDPSEVKALRAIRRNLNDPMKNLNWTREDPCMSNWNGVLCFNTTREDGFLHVRVLQLLNMNLSGSLAPELGQLSHMEILDFMWNKISGNIPKEIGKISSLKLLLLNGNELSGSLPEEIGNLSNLDRIQIDQNHISGPLPLSFAKLGKVKHFHMNNNSISGQIPVEYSQLPNILHILLDNNNLTGNLPAELSELPNLLILFRRDLANHLVCFFLRPLLPSFLKISRIYLFCYFINFEWRKLCSTKRRIYVLCKENTHLGSYFA